MQQDLVSIVVRKSTLLCPSYQLVRHIFYVRKRLFPASVPEERPPSKKLLPQDPLVLAQLTYKAAPR